MAEVLTVARLAAGLWVISVVLTFLATAPAEAAVSHALGPQGYWVLGSGGAVYGYGSATDFGSTQATRSSPIVGLAATPDGRGYWLVASGGGIISYGDARYYGSTGGTRRSSPIVGMAATPDGRGYWLVASDGDVAPFGDADRLGPGGGSIPTRPVIGLAAAPDSVAPPAVTTTALPGAVAGAFYSVTLTVRGGRPPYSWTLNSGTVPHGLILGSNGTISGTPTSPGTYDFGVEVSDSASPTSQTAVADLSISVLSTSVANPAPSPLTITNASLPGATVGSPYSAGLTALGGSPPYHWTLGPGALPAGLTLSPSGAITGTPTNPGSYVLGVEVTDSTIPTPETAVATLPLEVSPAPITSSPNWSGYVVPSTALFTEASGEWTVPTLHCSVTPNGGAGVWVGVGGGESMFGGVNTTLLQTGVLTTCVAGEQQDVGFWEEFPSNPNYSADFADFPVEPGDLVRATVSLGNGGAWETRVDDLTTGLSGVMITGDGWGVISDGASGSFHTQGSTTELSYSGGETVEWIVEDYSTVGGTLVPLADYGSVAFSGLTTSLSSWSLSPTDAVEMIQSGAVLSTPLPSSGNGFTVTYAG